MTEFSVQIRALDSASPVGAPISSAATSSPAHVSRPVHANLAAETKLHTPPSLLLDEVLLFTTPAVTDEYKGLNTPFTRAVTEQETERYCRFYPALIGVNKN